MTCWVVIPCKPAGESKRRLAAKLDPMARQGLVEDMLAHVVTTAEAAPGVDRVCLIGSTRNGLPGRLALLADPGTGLNGAAAAALEQAQAAGASRVLLLAGDLPGITAEDIAALATTPPGQIGIAPDRHGTGTNALALPLPAAAGFRFAYGAGSQALHRAEAARIGLPLHVVRRPGLEQDIDEPDDLAVSGRPLPHRLTC